MNRLSFAIFFLILALGGVVVKKTYYYLPPKELKRRAKEKDKLAKSLYRAVAYGNNLSVLLWLYIALTTAAGLTLLVESTNLIIGIVAGAVILWLEFSFIPSSRITKIGAWLTKLVTPFIAQILYYLHPIFSPVTHVVEGHYIFGAHTRIFDKTDLIELLNKQKFQEDNHISDEDLDLVKHALRFNDHKLSDVMTPEEKVKTVLMDDTIGPILIDELHKTRQDYVLVRDEPKGQIVGSLAYKKLNIRTTGKVKDLMNQTIYFLNEDDSLLSALDAFLLTSQPVFIVINSNQKLKGILTISDVFKQLIGKHETSSSVDDYIDAELVASKYNEPENKTDEETAENSSAPVNSTE